MLEDKLNQDLKQALLSGDASRVAALRMLKSAILYAKVSAGTRDQAMPDAELISILQKEAKKRQESADLYQKGGNGEKAQSELAEKAIIENYLPAQLGETELRGVVDAVVAELGASGPAAMGVVIAKVRERTAGAADGTLIARLAKERLSI